MKNKYQLIPEIVEIVEAEQFFVDEKPWPGCIFKDNRLGLLINLNFEGKTNFICDGDWIIRHPGGKRSRLDPDTFIKKYKKL